MVNCSARGSLFLEAEAGTKFALEEVVKIERASLKLCPNRVIYPVRHAVLDLVTNVDQELKVITGSTFHRASRMLQAFAQLPVSVCALGRLLVLLTVIYAFTPEPGVKEVGPRDDCNHEKHLTAKYHSCGIEILNGSDHCLTGLEQKLVTTNAQAVGRIHIRP